MAKIRISAMIPDSNDPLSFYRGIGPFRRMVRDNEYEIDFYDEKAFNWSRICTSDILFAQRPFKPEHLSVIRMAKEWGLKIVVDYDDYLFDLKTDNPAWPLYIRNPNTKNVLTEVSQLADLLFVTTKHLKKMYLKLGVPEEKIMVIPNAYDSKLFQYAKTPKERRKIVLWRGSSTHITDCMSVLHGYEELIKKHTDWIFIFWHQYPWFFSKDYPNVAFLDGEGIQEYFRKLHEMAPSIMTHPLSDCDFNKSKSMACFLEATHAGATFVGPDFEEFDRPGIVKYKPDDGEDFFNQIDGLITNPINIIEKHVSSKTYVDSELELGVINKIRWEGFKKVLAL